MFDDVPINVVFCIKDIDANNLILSQISDKLCSSIDCSINWKSNQKLISDNNECIEQTNVNLVNTDNDCYYSCKACDIEGNIVEHKCTECNDSFLFAIKNNEYMNCYENCSYNHYFDNEYNYFCTIDSFCPNEYPKLIENKRECIIYTIEDIQRDILNYENNETQEI